MRKDAAGHWQVWVASARLADARRLTNGAADSGWHPHPGDSTQINDIFVMNPDGSGVMKLTDSKGASADAAWSRTGR